MPDVTSARPSDRTALVAAVAVSLAVVVPVLYRGWVPFDEGWMMEQALRVQAGQLPHRDFTDLWTGGWSFVHAGLFALFGPSMAIIRSAILVAWTGGLVLVYRIARWYAEPLLAATAVVCSALWTLWAWQLPLLNWFYFPGALLAVACVGRFERTQRERWLAAAGAAAGLLFTFKVTGLYLLAALLLWATDRAVRQAIKFGAARDGSGGIDARIVAMVPPLVLALLSVRLAMGMPGAESALVLIAGPNLLFAIGVAATVWRRGPVPLPRFVGAMTRYCGAIAAGFVLPVVLLLLPYIGTGSVIALVQGALVDPFRRFTTASFPPPWWRIAAKFALPMLLLWLGVPRVTATKSARTTTIVVTLGAALGAVYALLDAPRDYLIPTLSLVPVALAGAWAWRAIRSNAGSDGAGLLLLVGVAATAQLLLVPFATINYFLASAPLLIVVGVAFAKTQSERCARRGATLFVFAALVAAAAGVRRIAPINEEIRLSGDARVPSGDAIWIPRADSLRAARVIGMVRAHLAGGGLYLFPWHNEFYYFTDTRNPTRLLTATLAGRYDLDPRGLTRRLNDARTSVVVVFPPGTAGWDARWEAAANALRDEWRCVSMVDDWAEVRWKPAGAACDVMARTSAVPAPAADLRIVTHP